MFKAECDGRVVDLSMKTRDDARKMRVGKYKCRFCGGDAILKAGSVVSPHFAHKSTCSASVNMHPESAFHRSAKKAMGELLRQSHRHVEIEYYMKEISRVADIAVLDGDVMTIHEIQLSPITVEDLSRRISDYLSMGFDSIWWLGNKADTHINRDFFLDNNGVFFRVEIEDRATEVSWQKTIETQ